MNSRIKLLFFSLCSLLLVLAAAACASRPAGDNSSSSAGGNAAPASPGSTAGGGSSGGGARAISADDKPLDVMTRAVRAQLAAKSYRARVTSSLGDETANNMLIEYAAPDRYHMTREGQAGGAGENAKMEFVVVSGAMYLKTPDGRWVKSPVDAGQMIKAFHDPKMVEEMAKTADVKFVGPDTLDGAPMLVYQYTQNQPMGLNIKTTAKTWLSVADGMPRKTETEGMYEGKKIKTLVTIFDYNADIKIESPVK